MKFIICQILLYTLLTRCLPFLLVIPPASGTQNGVETIKSKTLTWSELGFLS